MFIAFSKKVSYNVALEAFYGKKKNDQDCCMAVDRYLMCRQYPYDNESGRTLHILALGDSIALGYGLEDKEQEAYGAVLAKSGSKVYE